MCCSEEQTLEAVHQGDSRVLSLERELTSEVVCASPSPSLSPPG